VLTKRGGFNELSFVVNCFWHYFNAGCQSTGADAKKELDTIKFADAQWDSLQVHNYIAGTIMEEGYGYVMIQK